MSIVIKATQEAVTRRIPFQEPATLASLRTQLSSHFDIPAEARITYKDEDGDDITFSTDAELVEQVTVASATPNKVIRLNIVASDQPTQQVPQLDTLITNISELVTAIRRQPTQPPAKRVCVRTLKPDRSESRKAGLFSGIRPLFSAFPQRQGLRTSVKAIDQETKTSFKSTVSAIKKSKERKKLLSGLNTATPALRELITDLPDDSLPTIERVQVFITAVEACLKDTDDNVIPQVSEFIMTAASDPALVDCLRKVKDVPLMPWESGFLKSVATPRGFDVHQITCAGCKKSPIVGTRFECAAEGISLCTECHTKDNLTHGRSFVQRKYVWEKNCDGLKVPPPPLRIGERGIKVKFLHKVLTDLGFMNSSMYSRRPGLFSGTTQKAIAAFQAENNIAGEAGVYDEVTANRLKQVVSEREMTEATGDSTMEVAADVAMKA